MHILNAVEVFPARSHSRPRWDRKGTYHKRVQKKWNKRFGMIVGAPKVLALPDEVFDKIRKQLR